MDDRHMPALALFVAGGITALLFGLIHLDEPGHASAESVTRAIAALPSSGAGQPAAPATAQAPADRRDVRASAARGASAGGHEVPGSSPASQSHAPAGGAVAPAMDGIAAQSPKAGTRADSP
ncbi:MAG: hypothetical protein EXR27_16335 [Betaproteobacteria bacterium]|nr:hypothetical protein [Betaproteobacteria bacterium]